MASSSNTEIKVAALYPDNVPDVEDVVATLILKRDDIRVQSQFSVSYIYAGRISDHFNRNRISPR